jgi:hypothetical protein
VRALESEAIPYMVTGSVASSYHGRPRSTHDADIVIDPAAEQFTRLVRRRAPAGFYVDDAQDQDALSSPPRAILSPCSLGVRSRSRARRGDA